jgi:hypothetical protein
MSNDFEREKVPNSADPLIRSGSCPPLSILTVQSLVALVSLLRLNRKCRNRSGFQTPKANRFARILAIAIRALVQPFQGGIDLNHQFALSTADSQFERPFGV